MLPHPTIVGLFAEVAWLSCAGFLGGLAAASLLHAFEGWVSRRYGERKMCPLCKELVRSLATVEADRRERAAAAARQWN